MRLLCVVLLVVTLGLASGCETVKRWTGNDTGSENVTFTYDFDDILIPSDMTIVDSDRWLYENEQFRFGKIPVKGRVDQSSLETFFLNNMRKDGWSTNQSFKAERAMLFFEKPGKSCVIKIMDGIMNVTAEILVVELKSARSGGSSAARPASSRSVAPVGGPAAGSTLKEKGLSQ